MKDHLKNIDISQGIYFALEIDFQIEGLSSFLLSTRKRVTDLGTTISCVESFGDINSLNKVTTYGTSHDLSIQISDSTGTFLNIFKNSNHYKNKVCYIYLGVGDKLYHFLDLEIDSVNYIYEERSFILNLTTINRNAAFGDLNINNYILTDALSSSKSNLEENIIQDLFNESKTVESFGTIEKYPFNKMFDELYFEVLEDTSIYGTSNNGEPYMRLFFGGDNIKYLIGRPSSIDFLLIGQDKGDYVVRLIGTSIYSESGNYFTQFYIYPQSEPSYAYADNSFYNDLNIEVLTDDTDIDPIYPNTYTFKFKLLDSDYPWLLHTYLEILHDISAPPFFTGNLRRQLYVIDQQDDVLTVVSKYRKVNATKINRVLLSTGLCYTVKKGSKLIPLDLWKARNIIYIDSKIDTNVVDIYHEHNDKHYKIPSNQYDVIHTDGEDENKLLELKEDVDSEPLACTYVKLKPDSFVRYKISSENIFSGSIYDPKPVITTQNEYGTLLKSSNYLSEKYGNYSISFSDLTLLDKNINFILDDTENLYDILTDIVRQCKCDIRDSLSLVTEIVPLIQSDILFTFNKDNILKNSVVFSNTDKAELYTYFPVTIQKPDFTIDLIEKKIQNNTDLYGFIEYPIDYYIWNSNESENDDNINFWVEELSNGWFEITLKTSLNTIHLELYDKVSVIIPSIDYYDVGEYGSFEPMLSNSDTLVDTKYDGLITSIKVSFESGYIEYKIKTEIKML